MYSFSGKWFQEVVILHTRLEGAQCKVFCPPGSARGIPATGGHCCTRDVCTKHCAALPKLAYAKSISNFPGLVENSLMQTSFCLHWWMAWWPEKCGWEIAVFEARGREAGRPSAWRVYAVIKYKEFHAVWILLSCIWRGRGWMPLWVKATFLLLLSGWNLVVVRGA